MGLATIELVSRLLNTCELANAASHNQCHQVRLRRTRPNIRATCGSALEDQRIARPLRRTALTVALTRSHATMIMAPAAKATPASTIVNATREFNCISSAREPTWHRQP